LIFRCGTFGCLNLQPKNRGMLAHIRARHLHFFESVTKTEYQDGEKP
jgi:hypothetical protein